MEDGWPAKIGLKILKAAVIVKSNMKVQSLARAFDILELLSREQKGITLTDISLRVNLHKSTVYRILSDLMERGYIEKRDTHYRLGLQFIELSSMYLNSMELKTEAEPVLRDLSMKTSQTAFLAVIENAEIIYMDKMETFNSIRKYSIIGQRRPVYCTSLGKAFLMNMTNGQVKELLAGEEFKSITPKTITSIENLLEDLDLSRKRGWTFDDEEYELNIQCVGAPVRDYRGQTIAAVSSVWYMQETQKDVDETARLVMEAASKISVRMGYRG